MKLRMTAAFALVLSHGCNCVENLNEIPTPTAVLAYGDDETPPLERLEVGLGAVQIGQSGALEFTLRNDGDAPLTYASMMLGSGEGCPSPSSRFDLQAEDLPGGEVSAGDSIDISVTFSPDDGVPGCTILSLNTNDEKSPSLEALITGQGDAAALCTDNPFVDFGEVLLGDTATGEGDVYSCGTRAVTISSVTPTAGVPPFDYEEPTLPVTLEPGEHLLVPVSFTPTIAGPHRVTNNRAGVLEFGTDVEGALYQVILEGDAVEPPRCKIAVVPSVIQFGGVYEGYDATQGAIVQNLGDLECNVSEIRLSDTTAAAFSIDANTVATPLAPGATGEVMIAFEPDGPGTFTGALEVLSDDPTDPQVSIPIEGTGLETQPCMLLPTPTSVAFGFSPLGETAQMTVTLESAGTENCTVSELKLSAATSNAFSISGWGGFAVIPPGQTRTFEVNFKPLTTALQTGAVEIKLGFLPLGPPDVVIPVSGQGAGPKLCIDPDPVVFASQGLGVAATQDVSLINCGTDDLDVTAAALGASTPAEFSIVTPPAFGTVAPGASLGMTLGFSSATAGTFTGVLEVSSDDPISPLSTVDLYAGASGSPCGDLVGVVCGLDGTSPAPGATVWVDTASGPVETTAGDDGTFVLSCLPAGSYTVTAESGNWTTSFPAQVNDGQVTTLPTPECLDPTSAEIAVVTGEWDSIESVLADLGIDYTLYDGVDEFASGVGDLVNDASELGKYDIVFFNCGFAEDDISPTGYTNLRNFVDNGGSVYGSDWSYDVIEVGWPDAVDFYGDDTVRDNAEGAGTFNGQVSVNDVTLQASLGGRTEISITSCCTGIDAVGAGTTAYLTGDRLGDGVERPLMIGFETGLDSGSVFYTDFHNGEQADINDIFVWLLQQL